MTRHMSSRALLAWEDPSSAADRQLATAYWLLILAYVVSASSGKYCRYM